MNLDNLTQLLKRAPRWAWYSAAGVGIGTVLIYAWRHRAAPAPTDPPPTDSPPVPEDYGAPSPLPAVVVPPLQNYTNTPDTGIADLQKQYIDSYGPLVDFYEDFFKKITGGGPPSDSTPGQHTVPPPGGKPTNEFPLIIDPKTGEKIPRPPRQRMVKG